MTISCRSARRRYLERSSFTSDSATFVFFFAFLREPFICILLGDDCQYLNTRIGFIHIVEYSNVLDAQAILGPGHTAQPLNPTLAYLCRLVAKVTLYRVLDGGPLVRLQLAQIFHRFGR